MRQVLHMGRGHAREFVRDFIPADGRVLLVTGRSSYGQSGARAFLESVPLRPCAGHLAVGEANPTVDEAQDLVGRVVGERVSALVAVGGGTVIDTAKLVNLALVSGLPVRSLLSCAECPPLMPLLAVPTTAGTGAEATRFAVCFDGETKFSVDFPQLCPSHVLLMPDFIASVPAYQRASTAFDAYAQAIESLWAKGATEESRRHAGRALEFLRRRDDDAEVDLASAQQGAYWSGRAICISRTTAAHALSYYLTAHYGIPHGHAVFMVFPHVLENNAGCLRACGLDRDEIAGVLERFHRSGLTTLREFAAERGLAWQRLVDELFAHVNLQRLGNNPVELKRESFDG